MRVVFDTNVFISAVLKDNSLPALAVNIVEQRDTLLKSDATEQQLFEVLTRPYLAPLLAPASIARLKALFVVAELISISQRVVACRDSTDDKFLELAINGRAELIVTGDRDLLVLDPFRNIPIVTPATFVQQIAQR
ncbi:MAG TPA: putative toxin-antitoxin system toxin component, PIN family [Stellaceae bacterium]|jgi:putative PIN family toxin of toxin-antitoxin system|nr:putative toxin-antitoxin system toxin component, PIN family [Stellaceae bacterium]